MIIINSFISRIGGKKLLRKEILKRFPKEKPQKYVEVFGGAGWVLFASASHAKVEVFNDIEGNLVNLFRCVKYHCEELERQTELLLHSREIFEDIKAQLKCRGFTDIQRAAQYYMLIKESYGSSLTSFGGTARNMKAAREYLSEASLRLQRVKIECKDFENLIKIYDSVNTLFYLDPPYHGTEEYYCSEFTNADHLRLFECLKNIKGKFILSYNDDDFIRQLYNNYDIESIDRQNNLAMRYPDKAKKYNELIIRNYK